MQEDILTVHSCYHTHGKTHYFNNELKMLKHFELPVNVSFYIYV